MQFILKDINEAQATEFFLNDPKLCYMGLSDMDMYELYYDKIYTFSPISCYQGVYRDDELIGMLRYEYFSEVAVVVHIYISAAKQGKGLNPEINKAVHKHLSEHTQAMKLITTVPEPCVHVQKAIAKLGFTYEGRVTDSYVWRQKTVDLLYYGCKLEREDK